MFKGDIPYDHIYKKFKKSTTMVTESRPAVAWGQEWGKDIACKGAHCACG